MSARARALLLAAIALALFAATADAQALGIDSRSRGFVLKTELSGIGVTWENSGWFTLPILAWNLALAGKLRLDSFSGSIPKWYEVGESILRGAALAYPFLRPVDSRSELFLPGLGLYAAGTALYFASWLPLMSDRPPAWAKGLAVQLAPTYTPMLWLAGIALMGDSPFHLGISFLFVAAHVGEYLLRWRG